MTVTMHLKSICVFNFRVSSLLDDLKGDLTEQVSFRTESCEPDPPATPKLSTRTKTSLLLKWNVGVFCNISLFKSINRYYMYVCWSEIDQFTSTLSVLGNHSFTMNFLEVWERVSQYMCLYSCNCVKSKLLGKIFAGISSKFCQSWKAKASYISLKSKKLDKLQRKKVVQLSEKFTSKNQRKKTGEKRSLC